MANRVFHLLSIVFVLAGLARAASVLPTPGRAEAIPDELKNVTIDEKPNAPLPLDLTFVNERGQAVRLGDYFTGNKPVILQLGYYGCPMLCDLVSQGLLDSLKPVELDPGADFEVVYVSFDPRETQTLAYQKKQAYMRDYGRPQTAGGWHFLTGKEEQINQLTQAVGFQYKWIEAAGQYSHPAAIMLVTPDGRLSRYLYGVRFDPRTLRLSLVEASQGKIGTSMDKFILTCFRYDGKQGKYAFTAVVIMRIGGALTVLILGTVLYRLFRREARRRAAEEPLTPSAA